MSRTDQFGEIVTYEMRPWNINVTLVQPGFIHSSSFRNVILSKQANEARFKRFFATMLEQGVYLAPSPFETGFVSLAHKPRDIEITLAAARVALRSAALVR